MPFAAGKTVQCISTVLTGNPASVTAILLRHTAKELLSRGWNVLLTGPEAMIRQPGNEELSRSGAKLCPFRSYAKSFAERLSYRVTGTPHATLHLQKYPADLVVINQGETDDGLDWAESCADLGLPYLLICHAVRTSAWPDDQKSSRLLRGYRNAELCVFVSHGNRRLFELQVGAKLENAIVVPSPCLVGRNETIPWPESFSPLKLACPARLNPVHKGQDLLVQVAQNLKRKRLPVQINCFGEGPAEGTLHRAVEEWGVESHIQILPKRPVREIWAEHHGLILPSRSEGFSLSIMEAMLLARPVIVSDVGDNETCVKNGKSGFVTKVESVEDLTHAVEWFYSHRKKLPGMGAVAKRAILKVLPPNPEKILATQIEEVRKAIVPLKRSA